MPRSPPNSSSIPLQALSAGPSALLSPQQSQDAYNSAESASDLVDLSKESSRQPSPFTDLPHPDSYSTERRLGDADNEDSDFEHWGGDIDEEDDMPSDLRDDGHRRERSAHSQPLLSGDKPRQSYDQPIRPVLSTRRSGKLNEREAEDAAKAATRKRYTYAAGFLLVSLVAFAVQTETAVYIQHKMGWNKAYAMLYVTHGSWSLLWPTQLLVLRIQKWQQPWPAFWRRHVAILRQTGQMVEHRTLHIPHHLQKKSPVPYFLRTTAFVTCALTIAGGSWYVAVDLTTASDLTAIYNCSAFFAYAFAIPLLHDKLRFSKVVAVAVAIIGVLIVAYGDQGAPKHGNKSGGGAGGPHAPADDDARNRTVGNIVIGIGSVLYGFYEVLYKKVACPPDNCPPEHGMVLAMTFGSLMGAFTLLFLWIPIPILHILGWETFELPHGDTVWMLAISVLSNATFSGCFLVLISLTSPVLSSVAALLTIFLVALCDEFLPPPLYSPITAAAMAGGLLIIFAFLLLSWATYKEMNEERQKRAEETIDESDIEDL